MRHYPTSLKMTGMRTAEVGIGERGRGDWVAGLRIYSVVGPIVLKTEFNGPRVRACVRERERERQRERETERQRDRDRLREKVRGEREQD